jgi:N12 class adenine-specific DNA methylase
LYANHAQIHSIDGSFQTFPGLDLSGVAFNDWYPSQKDVVLRIKSMNGGIIDHEAGGGKTIIDVSST